MSYLKLLKDVMVQAGKDFMEDECPQMAAALSYYTIFALPAVLMFLMFTLSLIFDADVVSNEIEAQFTGLLGAEGGGQLRIMLSQNPLEGRDPWGAVLGGVMLLFGATGLFVQLQTALNRAWEVKPVSDGVGLKDFMNKRLLSFGVLLTIAFLLVVSLMLNTAVALVGGALSSMFGVALSEATVAALHQALFFVLLTTMLAIVFRYLPDAEVEWSSVGLGAVFTSTLLVVGKYAIGLYIGNSDVASAYGAASSLAVVLVWIYYTSMLFLFGAECTQAWARQRGHGLEPSPGAVRVDGGKRDAPDSPPGSPVPATRSSTYT